MADVLGATRRMQDVTDHERSVRWLRSCCLRRFGAGCASHDGLGKLGWLCIGDTQPAGRRRRRRRFGLVAAPRRLLLLVMYVYSCNRYGRTAGRSRVTRVTSVLLRLHDCGRFHTLRASVLQMVTQREVENHRSSARSSEVSVKIFCSVCPSSCSGRDAGCLFCFGHTRLVVVVAQKAEHTIQAILPIFECK